MSTAEEVMDRFSGMITREQAAALESGGDPDEAACSRAMDVDSLLRFIDRKRAAGPLSGAVAGLCTVNVQDYVYRIFNPITRTAGSRQVSSRSVVLGREGRTMTLSLIGKLSEFIDIDAFERQDLIAVDNALLGLEKGELVDGRGTLISRIAPAQNSAITDYSRLKEGLRNIDVIGKIIEIGPVRYVNMLNRGRQIAVSDCVLTDLDIPVSASLWGSSAIATTRIKVNDFVKMEFCNARMRDGSLELYAGELSRVVANKAFARRLAGRG
jgi:hypothetical protein